MQELHQCANCGRTIGALEQPFSWGSHIVCASCVPLLQASSQIAPASPPQPRMPVVESEPIDSLAAAAQRAVHRSRSRHLGGYVDPLAKPRFVMLLVAIGFSLLVAVTGPGPDILFAYILWAAWVALIVVGIVQKANWQSNRNR